MAKSEIRKATSNRDKTHDTKAFHRIRKRDKAKIVNDRGTLTIECEDKCTIRRAIISNIIIEEDIVVEGKAGRERAYPIPREKLIEELTNT
jgi:predicted MarR family transcription regulator